MRETMAVEAIESGTVIDHIPAGQGLTILAHIQKLNADARLTVGLNLRSKSSGIKDIIKVEEWLFSERDAAEMALFAPQATVNIIANYRVIKKFNIGMPEEFHGIFACPNSNCISNSEPCATRFAVRVQLGQTFLRCHYCERSFADTLFKQR